MLNRIYEILFEISNCDVSKMNEDSNLIVDLGLSSLDLLNAVVMFEDEFKIEIPDENIKNLTSVGDIKKYLEEHV